MLANCAGKPFTYDGNGTVSLHFDMSTVQSRMRPDQPDQLVLGYTRTMMGSLLLNPQPQHITQIGLGGGSLAKYCHRYLPDAVIDVAEINPDIIALRDEFAIPPDSARFRVHCDDGARFIAAQANRIDLLFVDGFDADGQAPSLCTQRFYDDCQQALTADGLLVINLSGMDPHIAHYLDRLGRSFGNEVVVIRSEDCTNKIAFAAKGPALQRAEAELLARAWQLEQQHPLKLRNIAHRLAASRRHGYFLTDEPGDDIHAE